MLGASRPARLCCSCRYDLLRLFEFGFASTTRHRNDELRRRLPSRRDGYRLFSQARISSIAARSTNRNGRPDDAAAAEPPKQTQAVSDAAQDESERLNEQVELLYQRVFEAEETPEAEQGHLRRQYLEILRASQVTTSEIVRHARQKFGKVLPQDFLNGEEYALYVRLYGEPGKEDIGEPRPWADERAQREGQNQLLQKNREAVGVLSEGRLSGTTRDGKNRISPSDGENDNLDAQESLNGQPLQQHDRDLKEIADSLEGEVYFSEAERKDDEEDDEEPDEREHPLTKLGRFATSPRTTFLPQDTFVKPVEAILSEYSNKHLKEMCEKSFGGRGLPDSSSTPQSSLARQRQQVSIPLDPSQHIMGEMEANAYVTAVMPQTLASILSVLTETRKRMGASWLRGLIMKEGGARVLDAGAGGAGILAWNEIVKAEWASLHGSEAASASPAPPSKAVVLVGSDTLRRRASSLLENTTFVPRLPDYVHTRDQPTLDDSRPVQQRKQFDIVIAPHTLFPIKEDYLRKQHVQNLWSLLSPSGGVLVLMEKGIPRGFEAIAGAREFLLDRYISSPGSESYESPLSKSLAQEEQITPKQPGMIIAPCTNHTKCPMYTMPGTSSGRKDFCAFQQRFIRPKFLQRVVEGSQFNDEDVKFSYVSVLKGQDLREKNVRNWEHLSDPTTALVRTGSDLLLNAEEKSERSADGFEVKSDFRSPSATKDYTATKLDAVAQALNFPASTLLPRLVFPPMKRKGHVTMDVCTSAGRIERWTVPKSFSAQAYRDGRKSRWGDLWGLGAKTVVPRNLRLGVAETKEGRKMERKKRRVEEREELLQERSEEAALGELDMLRDKIDGDHATQEHADPDALEEDLEASEISSSLDHDDSRYYTTDQPTDANAALYTTPVDLPSQPTPKDGANPSPQAQRLLNTLRTAHSNDQIDAELREWEAEYAADRRGNSNKNNNSRNRDDRVRIRSANTHNGREKMRTGMGMDRGEFVGGGAKRGKGGRDRIRERERERSGKRTGGSGGGRSGKIG